VRRGGDLAVTTSGCSIAHLAWLPGDAANAAVDWATPPGYPPVPEAAGRLERRLHEQARY
jgi:hypothetical protein